MIGELAVKGFSKEPRLCSDREMRAKAPNGKYLTMGNSPSLLVPLTKICNTNKQL